MLSTVLTPIMRSRFWDDLAVQLRSDRFRRRLFAVTASVACHLILIMAFLWAGKDGLRGQVSPSLEGSAMDGDAAAMPIDLKVLRGQEEGQAVRRVSPEPSVVAVKAPAMPAENASDKEAAQASTSAEPAAQLSNALPADSLADGRADGTQDILSQIARCLPDGVRPALPARLDLTLDAKGELVAAPRMEQAANAARDVKAENLVVQAALQCGPYKMPGGGSFEIAADFSKVGAP